MFLVILGGVLSLKIEEFMWNCSVRQLDAGLEDAVGWADST